MPKLKMVELKSSCQKRAFVHHEQTGQFFYSWHAFKLGRLLFVEKGVIHIKVCGKQLLVPAKYCAWIPAETRHEIWATSNDVMMRNVYFESSFCSDPIFHKMAIFNGSDLFVNMIRHTEKWNTLTEENNYELTFTTVLRQMMPEEMEHAFSVSLPSSENPQLQPVLDHIHDNYDTSIKISDLLKISNMSLRSLQRLFTAETGISYSTYLKLMRIIKAVELLSTTKMRISEIAWEVGYNSVPTFTNTFKEITGQRPDFFQRQERGVGLLKTEET